DRTLEFLGRTDFQVKIRGFRVEPGEVEAQLAAHPAVRAAVVAAREDAPGDRRLVAYYLADEAVDADTLRAHLARRVPGHMLPAAYVRLDALPLTPNGKVDRKALPAPDDADRARRGYEAPVGETEIALAEIWAEVLGTERVGRQDNFFELGGHSLLAVQVVSRAGRALGVDVALASIFSHPTVESLAAKVRGVETRGRDDRAIAIRPDGVEAPLFLVHEGSGSVAYAQVLHPHLDPAIPVYALPAASASHPPLGTVEEMAARLLERVREVQPEGPYRLAGWSFGGTLAYEMAAQLAARDEAVEFVGMIDTYYLPESSGDGGDDFGLMLHLLRMAEAVEGGASGAEAEEGDAGGTDLEAFVHRCRERGLLPAHVTVAHAREMQARLRATRRALRAYDPRPLEIPVHLFPAERSGGADPRRGWQALLDDASLRVTPVPGTHLSMMRGPSVEALGRALSRGVRQAARRRMIPADAQF
ncbi:MAG TPA: thioesterase domain-containing protein, partial [Longimicrobium sp.]|nr:thioesterase domain-containing protein [Longimicrobium sp.]